MRGEPADAEPSHPPRSRPCGDPPAVALILAACGGSSTATPRQSEVRAALAKHGIDLAAGAGDANLWLEMAVSTHALGDPQHALEKAAFHAFDTGT